MTSFQTYRQFAYGIDKFIYKFMWTVLQWNFFVQNPLNCLLRIKIIYFLWWCLSAKYSLVRLSQKKKDFTANYYYWVKVCWMVIQNGGRPVFRFLFQMGKHMRETTIIQSRIISLHKEGVLGLRKICRLWWKLR